MLKDGKKRLLAELAGITLSMAFNAALVAVVFWLVYKLMVQ